MTYVLLSNPSPKESVLHSISMHVSGESLPEWLVSCRPSTEIAQGPCNQGQQTGWDQVSAWCDTSWAWPRADYEKLAGRLILMQGVFHNPKNLSTFSSIIRLTDCGPTNFQHFDSPHSQLLIKTFKNLTIVMDKLQLISWDGDINVLYTYMSYIYSYLIWFAASFIAWKCLLCWWEPSNKLEGLHCSALTLSKTHSTTTQGFGHEFGHRGFLSHLFGRFFGREESSKTEETLKIRRGSNERNMEETYHNPATRTKHTTVNESKHTLRSSMILLHHTGISQQLLKKGWSFSCDRLKLPKCDPKILSGGTWKSWIFNGPWGLIEIPLWQETIRTFGRSSHFLSLIFACCCLRWVPRQKSLLLMGGNRSLIHDGSWESGIPKIIQP